MRARHLLLLAPAAALFGCIADGPGPPDGPAVTVNVAALDLAGVGDVVWDVEVRNGLEQVVWQRRLTSATYGDGAGSASYVGPCDADPAAALNEVRVWVVGVYDGPIAGANAGTFNAGSTAGVGAVTGVGLPFQNPTTTAPLTREITCAPNADVAVQFDVALMRPAQQGFFDIAVNFNNVFCSAKFDCCADDDGNGCTAAEDIDLLFDASGQRARTFVLGFACTAGAGTDVETELYMDAIALDCTAPNAGTDFAADIRLTPAPTANGNLCTAGANGMTSCAYVTELAAVDADSVLFQAAVYRGEEALTSGGVAAHKAYWNVALGVQGGITNCRLRTRATADDAADGDDHVDGGVIAAGAVYPYVTWDVNLASCASEPLTFGVPGAAVGTAYTTTGGTATTFAYTFSPLVPSGPDGSSEALAAASCDALHNDFPAKASGSYWLDPDGAGTGVDAFLGYCEMAADGGWTLVLRGGAGVPTQATWYTTTAHNVAGAGDGTQSGPTFKLADATINAFGGVYRVKTAGTYVHTRYLPETCSYAHTSTPSAACRYTCGDVGLTSCTQGAATTYGLGIHGGEGTVGNGCGVQYFATCSNPIYMTGQATTYDMYWIVQTTGSGANNDTCAYGPGQKWQDNGNINANSTLTVWRR